MIEKVSLAKDIKCNVCHKTFKTKSKLIRHERSHTGEKPYPCEICLKSFSDKSNLVKHKKTHTGEKLFHCLMCQKSYANKGSLDRHTRVHTGEKPFSCECGKSYADRTGLVYHKKKCEILNKIFSPSTSEFIIENSDDQMKDENNSDDEMINPLDFLKRELFEPKAERGESETEASDDNEAVIKMKSKKKYSTVSCWI